MKMKKVLVTLLALIFILGTVATGFAAPASFSDVDDQDVKDAVTRLSALDILSGYPDGTFKPENTITRAEFAKIIVTALGVGDAAEYARGVTKFSDVPATHWASGYINVASDMGIINGYGNGKFGPEDKVTYAQAITMIVRALGYEPKAKALGGYPGGYLAIAAEKDITENVTIVNSLAANRGDIAIMVDAALDVPMMVQKTWGQYPEYEEDPDKTLLSDKLNVDEIEGRVIENAKLNEDLDKDEVKIKVTKVNGSELSSAETNKYKLLAGDPNELLGTKVKAWVTSDDEVIFADIKTNADDILADTVNDNGATISSNALKSLKLKDANKTYDVSSDADIYVNNEAIDVSDVSTSSYDTAAKWNGLYGKYILDGNGDIIFADLYKWDVLDGEVVVSVDIDGDDYIIEYFKQTETVKTKRLNDVDKVTVVKNGKTIDFEDIEEDDVIYIADLGSDEYYVVVVSETVEGELDAARTDKVKIDGTYYDVASNASYSIDNNSDIVAYNISDTDFEDMLGKEIKVILDLNGDVRHIIADVETASSTVYGVLMKVWATDKNYAKFFTDKGEIVTYEVKDAVFGSTVGETGKIVDGEGLEEITDAGTTFYVYKFTIDSDGVIDEVKEKVGVQNILANYDGTNDSYIDIANGNLDKDEDYFIVTNGDFTSDGPGRFYVNDDTKLFNLDVDTDSTFNQYDDSKFEMIEWADIEDAKEGQLYVAVIGTPAKDAEAVFVLKGLDAVGADDVYTGLVTDKYKNADADWIAVLQDGSEYVMTDSSAASIGNFITYKLNTSDEMTNVKNIDSSSYGITVVGYVYDVDGQFVKVKDASSKTETTYYKVASDAIMYDLTNTDQFKPSVITDAATAVTELSNVLVENSNFDVDDLVEIDVSDLTDADDTVSNIDTDVDVVKVFVNQDGLIEVILVGKFAN